MQGQKLCEKFLRKSGCKILDKNFSCKTGEIDLVAMDSDGVLVFVEVKTRANENFADAESAITKGKQQRLKRAANFFINKHKVENMPMRFDVVAVITGQAEPEIRHYKNAF